METLTLRYLMIPATCAVALLASGTALAADQGFYLEGQLGYGFPDEVEIGDDGLDGEVDFDEAPVYGGALGWKFPWFRLEANVSYRKNDADGLDVGGIAFDGGGGGEATSVVGLVNAFVDLDFDFPVRPFFGGGVGAAYVDVDTGSGAPIEVDDEAGAFAWNLSAGLGVDLSESVTLSASYRYLRLEGTNFSADLAGVDVGDVDIDDLASHEVLVGLRYTF